MSKDKPKFKENSRGELETTGIFYTSAELERLEKQIAEHHQALAAETMLQQSTEFTYRINILNAPLQNCIAIAMCGNTPETRVFAKRVLNEINEPGGIKELGEKLWEHRADFYMLEIDKGKYDNLMRLLNEAIPLLKDYTQEPIAKEDTRTGEHTALRHFVLTEFPNLQVAANDRLTARKARPPHEKTIQYANRVTDLLKDPKHNTTSAINQTAEENNESYSTIHSAYYRIKPKNFHLVK